MYSGGIYVREIGSINHETLPIRKQVATHRIVIPCGQHQMETSALGQWHLSITFFLSDRTDGLVVILPARRKTPH